MTLDEIRALVAGTTAPDWHALSADTDGALRAVLRRDLDVALAWGMDGGEPVEPHWSQTLNPSQVYPHTVEVRYRGQPVDRETYGVVDNGHGLVPWPTGETVTGWQVALVELLDELGASVGVGSVEEYLRRCGITVA
jgi:hypothetical protein